METDTQTPKTDKGATFECDNCGEVHHVSEESPRKGTCRACYDEDRAANGDL